LYPPSPPTEFGNFGESIFSHLQTYNGVPLSCPISVCHNSGESTTFIPPATLAQFNSLTQDEKNGLGGMPVKQNSSKRWAMLKVAAVSQKQRDIVLRIISPAGKSNAHKKLCITADQTSHVAQDPQTLGTRSSAREKSIVVPASPQTGITAIQDNLFLRMQVKELQAQVALFQAHASATLAKNKLLLQAQLDDAAPHSARTTSLDQHVLHTISHSKFQLGGKSYFCEGDRGSCEDIGGEIVRGVLDKHSHVLGGVGLRDTRAKGKGCGRRKGKGRTRVGKEVSRINNLYCS
jgi:hypothetical protein